MTALRLALGGWPRRALSIDRVWLAIAVMIGLLALAVPDQAAESVRFTAGALVEVSTTRIGARPAAVRPAASRAARTASGPGRDRIRRSAASAARAAVPAPAITPSSRATAAGSRSKPVTRKPFAASVPAMAEPMAPRPITAIRSMRPPHLLPSPDPLIRNWRRLPRCSRVRQVGRAFELNLPQSPHEYLSEIVVQFRQLLVFTFG